MKNKIVVLLTALMTTALLVACGSSDLAENTEATTVETVLETEPTETVAETESTETTAEADAPPLPTATAEPTEAPHEHNYTKTVTTEPTCETDGEATYTCECGDSYTEPIAAKGHIFESYTSNNDATYTADGTETATCICGETDTRTAEGSMLAYTYKDMDATMYVQKTVNVRSIPNTDGDKLGSLSANDEVKVTGQCAETSWYRIEYSGGVAYVSDSYLGNDKVVVEQPETEQTQSELPTYVTYAEVKAYAISLGYPIGIAVDNGNGTCTCYAVYRKTPDGYLSFDGEYTTMDADMTAARRQAEAILGFNPDIHNADFGKYKTHNIAKDESGYIWYVCIEQFWIVAK